MGWYTNYEVEFDEKIDWDDETVNSYLKSFNLTYLYLRDLDLPRIILCIYSQESLDHILLSLKSLYSTDMRYRVYGTQEWLAFKG